LQSVLIAQIPLIIYQSIALLHALTHPKAIILLARNVEHLDSVASEISAIDSNIKVIKGSVDITDAQAVSTFFTNLRDNEKVGRLDVLFNNAGYLEVLCASELDLGH
jgi:NADP-dependent 3-hydroxy acid dehydrogenase YdfG